MNHRARRRGEVAWYVASFAYSSLRVALADRFLAKYGLDVVRFAAVEFGSLVPYSLGTAKLVGALVDRRRRAALGWGLLATVGFVTPDLYAVTTTRTVPVWLFVVLAIWLSVGGAVGVRQVRRTLAERRRPNI